MLRFPAGHCIPSDRFPRSSRRLDMLMATFESLEKRELLADFIAGPAIPLAFASPTAIVADPKAALPRTPGKPNLQAASDNGDKSDDNKTSVTNPTFDIDKI